MRGDGAFVVSWISWGQDGSGDGIYLRRYDAAGVPQTGDVRANTLTTGDQGNYNQSLAMDAAGNFVVVWNSGSQDGSSSGVYAQRYNAAGQRVERVTRANTQTVDSQVNPAVAMAVDGSFVITWQSYRQDGSQWGIYAQRYNAAGVTQGREFRANAHTYLGQGEPLDRPRRRRQLRHRMGKQPRQL